MFPDLNVRVEEVEDAIHGGGGRYRFGSSGRGSSGAAGRGAGGRGRLGLVSRVITTRAGHGRAALGLVGRGRGGYDAQSSSSYTG